MKELGTEDTRPQPEINLPEVVACALGDQVQYETFRAHYEDVYKQIEDMEHLLMGRIKFSGNIGPMKFSVRTMKQVERSMIAAAIPPNSKDTLVRDMMNYEVYKVAICLVSLGSVKLNPTPVTADTTLASWVEANQDTINTVRDFDEVLLRHVSNICEDVIQAKQFAFMELLPNP